MDNYEIAVFWVWCFRWAQKYFDKIDGVVETEVWYAWWTTISPTYENIWDHVEVVKIVYDPERISFSKLLSYFWNKRDPTFCPSNRQYISIILCTTPEQRGIALEYYDKKKIQLPAPIKVEVANLHWYYKAEEYHQKFYLKHNIICD